ncbi:DUF4145 domain-containing protein [Burkholderia gladioli]|uniref:DUF4145 domain-containing protein n=1 Tax=Burkholderia gladioli TaxID=28095 RepID=UPI00163E8EDB|nr:DUF4145 domain-containing protein [Burkholderia gladioli]
MAELAANCPRCGYDKVSFDVVGSVRLPIHHGWIKKFEIFAVCRHCTRGTIFQAVDKDATCAAQTAQMDLANVNGVLNRWLDVTGHVSSSDNDPEEAPEYLPEDILRYFNEGAKCMAVGCFNAGAAMFRLCLDAATKRILKGIKDQSIITNKIRYSLGFRLEWLFSNNYLDKNLEELAECVKEDGNDGAHDGTLTDVDAEDLHDFTVALLERLYSQPARLAAAKDRRLTRRKTQDEG